MSLTKSRDALIAKKMNEVRLHPAQLRFLKSDALYRAFVGGIGSGKSWAGSYDLIKRAKPGRLYMVVAPTFGMLSDSTMRSFVTVATSLGVLDPATVKRSAPPQLKLRTGAEVIFRSGDDPSHLYGPNLSGIWCDEASLMPLEVFNVAIGRLREAGEQGWLSATFTPKGLSHWTHDVFNTGRPNTAIVFAKTRDNPFLPEAFHENVRGQYTSRLAAQELEGAFIPSEGAMFRRDWLKVVDTLPGFPSLFRAWDFAATPKSEKKSSDPDWTVGVLMGRSYDGDFYVIDMKRTRGTPQQVEALVLATAREDGTQVDIAVEEEGGSAGKFVSDVFVRLLAGFNIRTIRSTGSKAQRAMPLAAQAEGGKLKLLRGSFNKELLDEFESFPFGAHDDCVDAASLAFSQLAEPMREFDLAVLGVAGFDKPGPKPAQPQRDTIDLRPDAPGWVRAFRR